VVRIKVPLGLPDPTPHVPAANPPTKGKWELGRKLFFAAGWLSDRPNLSCATCHRPDRAFTDGDPRVEGSYNVPTLVNVAYNRHQFWDGRATYHEEVVQRTPEDEREPKEGRPFDHVWPDVVGRLRDSKSWTEQFQSAFGTPPTQDAVGRA